MKCRHYYKISWDDKGVCVHCGKLKDFKVLLEKDGFRATHKMRRGFVFPDTPYPAEGTHSYPYSELSFRMEVEK